MRAPTPIRGKSLKNINYSSKACGGKKTNRSSDVIIISQVKIKISYYL